ncbi:MAG: Mfa1 fimbrilin C-terminal domain-containing protein [Muribaculaceae bacterium]|nr:Mfa1 fimbrilin C-terminal domain-containing protein [Muribaculaceae bacterium]
MKKLIFIIPLLALLLAACSNETAEPEIGPEGPEDVKRSCITVALYAPAPTTRVDGYIDGSESENQVNTIRFFFFKEGGEPCQVFKQAATRSYLSYIDWIPSGNDIETGDPDITVEKIASATLGLNQPADEELPSLVLAVINPTRDILDLENPNLGNLKTLVGNYYDGLHDSNFLITNSVYVDKEGDEITATPITEVNFGDPTDEESMEKMKPIEIFVERVLARLDFSLQLDPKTNPSSIVNGKTIYKVSDPSVDGKESDVYVKFLGWNVTATSQSSRAIKMINPSWNEDIFGGVNNPWYIPQYHRSFWAINPQYLNYNYGDFNDAQAEDIIQEEGKLATVYLQENAADYTSNLSPVGPKTPTCVIIGAQLVNSEGEPLPLARWANRYYTQDNLLIAVANVLNLFQRTTENGEVSFDPIAPEYLKFVSPEAVTLPDGETPESYSAYVQLNEKGAGITWYNGDTLDATPLSKEAVNSYILNRVNYVLVWTSGYTYYYFDILHLGTADGAGYYGIVRNHLYKANLIGISGLGTPVFDPGKVIYPTKPSPDDNILNVEVNILQWRIVTQDYELTWP